MKITGQAIVHHTGGTTKDGRELVALAVIIAVSKGTFPKNFAQYTLVGSGSAQDGLVALNMITTPDHQIDRTADCKGQGIGGYYTQCIWRY